MPGKESSSVVSFHFEGQQIDLYSALLNDEGTVLLLQKKLKFCEAC